MNTDLDVSAATRRGFLRQAAFGASAVLVGRAAQAAGAPAQPKPADAGKRMKVGLYSITYLGIWYRGEALSLEQVIERARKYGYEGVEIDGKRPHGNPMDWPAQKCRQLKALAEDQGVPIYGVAANNDFSSPICEHREAQIAYVRDLIRMTSDFGAKTLRVFLAWSGVTRHPQVATYEHARKIWKDTHQPFTDEQTWAWCREGMVEAARYAGDYGVILALQNHAPVIRTHHDVLRMVKEVNSPHLKVSLDPDIMPDKSKPEVVMQAAKDVGPLQVLSHFNGEYKRTPEGTIQGGGSRHLFVRAMHEIGYTGYIGYELCHRLPEVNGQTLGIDYVDLCAQLAAEYMRSTIKQHYGA